MLFWTVVFITYYLSSLIKGNLYYNILKANGDLILKQAQVESKREKENLSLEILKKSWTMFLAIPLMLAEIIYLINAIAVDVHKFPSILILIYTLLSVVIAYKNPKKTDLTTVEGRVKYQIELDKVKKYSFKKFFSNLVFVTYFAYMFYIIVF